MGLLGRYLANLGSQSNLSHCRVLCRDLVKQHPHQKGGLATLMLSHFPPSDLQRKCVLKREYQKTTDNLQLPINSGITDRGIERLRSRHPLIVTATALQNANLDLAKIWTQEWRENSSQFHTMPSINERPSGFEQPRKIWTALNRVRTKHETSHRWRKIASSRCDCGVARQTIQHIVEEYPSRAYEEDLNDFLESIDNVIDYIEKLNV